MNPGLLTREPAVGPVASYPGPFNPGELAELSGLGENSWATAPDLVPPLLPGANRHRGRSEQQLTEGALPLPRSRLRTRSTSTGAHHQHQRAGLPAEATPSEVGAGKASPAWSASLAVRFAMRGFGCAAALARMARTLLRIRRASACCRPARLLICRARWRNSESHIEVCEDIPAFCPRRTTPCSARTTDHGPRPAARCPLPGQTRRPTLRASPGPLHCPDLPRRDAFGRLLTCCAPFAAASRARCQSGRLGTRPSDPPRAPPTPPHVRPPARPFLALPEQHALCHRLLR